MCVKWCKSIVIWINRWADPHRHQAMHFSMALCHSGKFVSTSQRGLFSNIFTDTQCYFSITKVILGCWASVSSQVCQVFTLWQKSRFAGISNIMLTQCQTTHRNEPSITFLVCTPIKQVCLDFSRQVIFNRFFLLSVHFYENLFKKINKSIWK